MISTHKAHMSSLNNSLNYRHSGRTLSTLPYNLVKNVKIKVPSDIQNWTHMVYCLKKKYLRNNALAFNEFRESNVGQAQFKAFAFFIQLSFELQRKNNGNNFACFLEWVKTNDENVVHHCGIRVHVFCNSGKDKNTHNICDDLFATNESRVVNRTVKKNRMDHDLWDTITSRFEYARQVADVYRQDYEASNQIDSKFFDRNEHPAHPNNVFRLDSKGFVIENACDLQGKPANYVDDQGNIVFPDESLSPRIHS